MKPITCTLIRVITILCIFTGCVHHRQDAMDPFDAIKAETDSAKKPQPFMEEYMLPQYDHKKDATPKKDEQLYLAVQDVEVKDVLMILAKDSQYNMIVDPDIKAKVTVDLKGVSMANALYSILTPLHYDYTIHENTIRVVRPQMQTRLFALNYVTSNRSGETMLSVSSGGKSDSGGSQSGGGSVKTENKAVLWEEIKEGLKSILFVSEQAGSDAPGEQRLVINEMSGTILVTSYHKTLMDVAEFLEAVDGSIQRQVMITAKIMEVNLSDSYKMGIDWAGIPNTRGNFTGTLTSGLAAALPRPSTVVQKLSPDQGLFQIGATKGDFSMLLDAIATQGEIHVLSSPRISTMNNQKAIIKAAREDSFFTIQREVNTEGGVLQENFSVERNDYTIGVVLDVTPQISANGEIIMNIHPSITEFVEEKTFPPGASGSDILANAPILDVREVDTMVRVKSGETVVIGGLMKESTKNKITAVPILSDIPIIGKLFKKTEIVNENIELVILLTPEIIVGQTPDKRSSTHLGFNE